MLYIEFCIIIIIARFLFGIEKVTSEKWWKLSDILDGDVLRERSTTYAHLNKQNVLQMFRTEMKLE